MSRLVTFTQWKPGHEVGVTKLLPVSIDPDTVQAVRAMSIDGEQYTAIDVNTLMRVILVRNSHDEVMARLYPTDKEEKA